MHKFTPVQVIILVVVGVVAEILLPPLVWLILVLIGAIYLGVWIIRH